MYSNISWPNDIFSGVECYKVLSLYYRFKMAQSHYFTYHLKSLKASYHHWKPTKNDLVLLPNYLLSSPIIQMDRDLK